MRDEITTIKQMKERMDKFVAERDWHQYHSPKNLAMGIAIETGELLEHFQWIDQAESRRVVDDTEHMALVREEIADVFSYILALAGSLDIDLSSAFEEKMVRNAEKYPTDLYRGKYKL